MTNGERTGYRNLRSTTRFPIDSTSFCTKEPLETLEESDDIRRTIDSSEWNEIRKDNMKSLQLINDKFYRCYF